MTQEGKKQMFGVLSGITGGLLLALAGFIYSSGSKDQMIKFNTERIYGVKTEVREMKKEMKDNFYKQHLQLEKIMEKLR